jgi:Tfp pilus assembly protein PilX
MNQPSSRVERRLNDERGIALIIALMAMLFMMALGSALMLSTVTEKKIANNFRGSSEALYAADAGLERSLDDLLTIADWNTLLDGSSTSAFVDGAPGTRDLADGTQLNLNEILAFTNCAKTSCTTADYIANTAERPWGVNNPRWQLFAYGRLDDMIPTASVNSPFYIVVMVGDDPSESDNNPLKDGDPPVVGGTNIGKGVIGVRAEAFGPFGVHKTIELTVARTDTSELERGYTGQRGQDEQNRRARKAAVQTPGKALQMQTLNTSVGGIG